MQVPPPVEVILTVVAVTAPLVAAGPKALTQSPTARAEAAALCVELTVVDFDVVMVSVSVLGVVGFFVFELDLVVGRVNWPGLTSYPDTVSVDPLTDFTLPDPMASDASSLRKLDEPLPLPPQDAWNEPPPSAPDPPKPGPPPRPHRGTRTLHLAPPPRRSCPTTGPKPVHEPLELAVVTVIERAAMVVLDFFEGVPVTLTQSPAASALTASVTVLENAVVDVQFTVVWPEVVFCTSMFDALASSAATLPLAPAGALAGAVVAAPAAELRAAAATRAVVPVPMMRAQRTRRGAGAGAGAALAETGR